MTEKEIINRIELAAIAAKENGYNQTYVALQDLLRQISKTDGIAVLQHQKQPIGVLRYS